MTTLSRPLVRAIDALRSDFTAFASDHGKVFARRADLAPKFIQAFDLYKRETGRGLIPFLRQLDPTMPATSLEYAKHRTFTAAWYLLRAEKRKVAPKRSSLTPFELLAVVLKSVWPAIPNHDAAWAMIDKVSKWHMRDKERLRRAVVAAKPLPILPHVPRVVRRQHPAAAAAVAADHPARHAS